MNGYEAVLRWVMAAASGSVLIVLVIGVIASHLRPHGRTSGAAEEALHPAVEALVAVGFFGMCILLWRPLPLQPDGGARVALAAVGAALLTGGLGLVLWGRVTLGPLYGVSSVAGARLHADHRLIVHGPYAHVRHPMYLGVEVGAIGGLLLYRTWTTVFLAVVFVGLVLRARREDELLRLEFGEQWEEYRRRVPGWIPGGRGGRRIRGDAVRHRE